VRELAMPQVICECFRMLRNALVRGVLAGVLALPFLAAAEERAVPGLPEGRILVLGDSITHSGGWVAWVEAEIRMREPEIDRVFINAGLSSETVSGLSEDGHAEGRFPRPDLHERLERVLAAVKPQCVIACYGMNDGIYLPLDEGRFEAFRGGIRKLREKVRAAGAEMIHLTPAAYDAVAVGGESPGYDEVLRAYSDWLISRREDGWRVIDVHAAMNEALLDRRSTEGGFTFSKDGVHPDAEGHRVMARAVLAGLGVEPEPGRAGEGLFSLISERQHLMRDAWLSETKHLRPGVKNGLPMNEALVREAELEERIRGVLKSGGGE
jgi:lysophospholipase L1-like esterase